MKETDVRAKKVEEALLMLESSLNSHLQWMHKTSTEGKIFHKKCVKEYLRIMQLVADLL